MRGKLKIVADPGHACGCFDGCGGPDQTLYRVGYPPNTGVKLTLSPTTEAPNAKMEAKVTLREGEAQVELSYSDLKPAILFGGDVTCYVLWAVTTDGFAKNLGEVPSGSPKGSCGYTTRLKGFALMVTAEAYSQVWQPVAAGHVRQRSARQEERRASRASALRTSPDAPAHDVATIRAVAWDSDRPVELVQAERVAAYAERIEAE